MKNYVSCALIATCLITVSVFAQQLVPDQFGATFAHPVKKLGRKRMTEKRIVVSALAIERARQESSLLNNDRYAFKSPSPAVGTKPDPQLTQLVDNANQRYNNTGKGLSAKLANFWHNKLWPSMYFGMGGGVMKYTFEQPTFFVEPWANGKPIPSHYHSRQIGSVVNQTSSASLANFFVGFKVHRAVNIEFGFSQMGSFNYNEHSDVKRFDSRYDPSIGNRDNQIVTAYDNDLTVDSSAFQLIADLPIIGFTPKIPKIVPITFGFNLKAGGMAIHSDYQLAQSVTRVYPNIQEGGVDLYPKGLLYKASQTNIVPTYGFELNVSSPRLKNWSARLSYQHIPKLGNELDFDRPEQTYYNATAYKNSQLNVSSPWSYKFYQPSGDMVSLAIVYNVSGYSTIK